MGIFNKKEGDGERINFLYKNKTFPLRYQVQQSTSLIINDESINEVNVEILWRIDSWEKNEEGFLISIVSEKYETKSSNQMADLIILLSKFNDPIDHLLIQLNAKGEPVRVVNQQEVFEKWLFLRNGEFADFATEEVTNNLLIGGDIDFRDVLPLILKSNYYILFLTPVYGLKSNYNPTYNKLNLESIIFSGNNIELILGERISNVSDTDISIEHIGTGYIQNYKAIEKKYNEEFKQLIDVPLSYDYDFYANYLYNTDGRLFKCKAEIQERANPKVISKQSYTITIIQ